MATQTLETSANTKTRALQGELSKFVDEFNAANDGSNVSINRVTPFSIIDSPDDWVLVVGMTGEFNGQDNFQSVVDTLSQVVKDFAAENGLPIKKVELNLTEAKIENTL